MFLITIFMRLNSLLKETSDGYLIGEDENGNVKLREIVDLNADN